MQIAVGEMGILFFHGFWGANIGVTIGQASAVGDVGDVGKVAAVTEATKHQTWNGGGIRHVNCTGGGSVNHDDGTPIG